MAQADMQHFKIMTLQEGPMPTDLPALPTLVHLGLTTAYTVLYASLFLFVYAQLVLILCYRHKRLSYQSTLLFLCLLWAALRTTLFSFYFKNPVLANSLPTFPFWLLYCFPVCLQFVTLCLLVLYFSQVVCNASAKYETSSFRWFLRVAVGLAILVFLVTNIACAVVSKQNQDQNWYPYSVTSTRVIINELLFLACGISLAVCAYKVTKLTSAKLILETKGTTVCKSSAVCLITIVLYVSRATYNIVVLSLAQNARAPSFNFGWINITDQGDMAGFSYVIFGVVLFIWEFLPTFLVVLFFRVRRPIVTLTVSEPSSNSSRGYIFDNPRRYDSDEDLFKSSSASQESTGPNDRPSARKASHSSPYGSFQNTYGFHHGNFSHSSIDDSLSNGAGSQPESSYLQQHLIPPEQPLPSATFHPQPTSSKLKELTPPSPS